jgi:hypothetical protein
MANGTVKPSSPGHNVYDVSMTITCGGLSAGTLTGLATVDTSGTTQKLVVAVSDTEGALSLTMDRI